MRYRVVCNCYFGRRYYEKGEVVDLADTFAAPPHLEALDTKPADAPEAVREFPSAGAPAAIDPEIVTPEPVAAKVDKPKRVTRKAGTAGK